MDLTNFHSEKTNQVNQYEIWRDQFLKITIDHENNTCETCIGATFLDPSYNTKCITDRAQMHLYDKLIKKAEKQIRKAAMSGKEDIDVALYSRSFWGGKSEPLTKRNRNLFQKYFERGGYQCRVYGRFAIISWVAQ